MTLGGTAGAATVAPDQYVQTVCGAIAPFAALTEQLGQEFQQTVDAYTAQPNQTTATALRQSLVDLLDQSAQSVDGITETTRTAGAPDVPRGEQFAAAVLARFGATAAALHRLAKKAEAMDVGSAKKFGSDFKRVVNGLDELSARLTKSSRRDPALKKAPASLGPIVVFLTTDAPGCPS